MYKVFNAHPPQVRRSSSLRPRKCSSEMRSLFTIGGVIPRSSFRFFICTGTASAVHSSTFSGLRVANTKLREFLGPTTGPPAELRVNSAILANAFCPRARKDPRCVTNWNGRLGSGDTIESDTVRLMDGVCSAGSCELIFLRAAQPSLSS